MHPAKTEVRFRNAGLVRALIVHALKDGLAREGTAHRGQQRRRGDRGVPPVVCAAPGQLGLAAARRPIRSGRCRRSKARRRRRFAEPGQAAFDVGAPTADVRFEAQPAADLLDRPLGAARTQIHETYIVSQTRDGLDRGRPARRA